MAGAHAGTEDVRPPDGARAVPEAALVTLCDLAGRPRGTGFAADHHGTVITAHEVVDGLSRLLVRSGDRTLATPDGAITPLPALGLALVHAEGLEAAPLPVSQRAAVGPGAYVRIVSAGLREARVLGVVDAAHRSHLLRGVLELAMGTAGREALRPGGGAAGGPVLDAVTGAVLGVVGTDLRSCPTEDAPDTGRDPDLLGGHRAAGYVLPLRETAVRRTGGPLAELLARNAATVPAYGPDLNLAAVVELTATSVASDGPARGPVDPVPRTAVEREFTAFAQGGATVLGLVGPPGGGRTTALAELAAHRHRATAAAPTLWLRGADLRDGDTSVADAARRALDRAGRIAAAARFPPSRPGAPGGPGTPGGTGGPGTPGPDAAGLGDLSPERLARIARQAGRPLLIVLDGPEEMSPLLAHRMPAWTEGTADWLLAHGARMAVGCRSEYWERAGAEFPPELLHVPADDAGRTGTLPACVRLGDLTAEEARHARERFGIPDGVLGGADARHPLTLRLLAGVRTALPDAEDSRLTRHEVFSAHLDLACLRVAVRLAAAGGQRGAAIRRLAAKVAGQVHEAARRSLGPGQGELDREAFEAVFPWGPAPASLGGGTGWARAVLTEGLLVPAGAGYRFADEEFADWLQGLHLDVDEALRALVLRRRTGEAAGHPLPVPRHRIGPVVQALLHLGRDRGSAGLARRLGALAAAAETSADTWWATRLLSGTLLGLPDAAPYTTLLRHLADRIAARQRDGRPAPEEFGPDFWTSVPLDTRERFGLLHRMVVTAPAGTGSRWLDAAARLLAEDPAPAQRQLTHWFDDARPLPAAPHATVAAAAQALLYAHRHRGLDDLTEALADCAHPKSAELLAVLSEEEPSALCRAVDRWARDPRTARRVAAVTHGRLAARHVRSDADRDLLRYAALALLARPEDAALHGGALAVLVRDPRTRGRHLPDALRRFVAGDPQLPAEALVPALATHPEPVLDAFRDRLRQPGGGEALDALAEVTAPALARRIAALIREAVQGCGPVRGVTSVAAAVAGYVDRRLDHGPTVRAVLLPLVTGLIADGPPPVRAALAAVLARPGTPASRPLRQELLARLPANEGEPVRAAVVPAAVAPAAVVPPVTVAAASRGAVTREAGGRPAEGAAAGAPAG
ncbi:trypsin-like peptidase domain-containing protein [Streptomyces abyssomicinicus]|uniref:trypsin-like peptidase domain-containing protein n=1 Tax=Streptomyces abyssomicinicus TaxID=574929 RepID=UPI00124F7FB3|nr:trypsin-like peptidase domain-containing protein [Streptomyces abyssomicinicus]